MSVAVTKFSSNQLETILADKAKELIILCGNGNLEKVFHFIIWFRVIS